MQYTGEGAQGAELNWWSEPGGRFGSVLFLSESKARLDAGIGGASQRDPFLLSESPGPFWTLSPPMS